MISKFIDRDAELSLLEKEWRGHGGKLLVLYGRRRVGKTRLLAEFVQGKDGVFYIASDSSPQVQIEELKTRVADFLNDALLRDLELKNWEQFFEYLTRNLPSKRFYLILDEFSYLVKSDRTIISVLQRVWDRVLSNSKVFLVLCGSVMGLMRDEVLSSASPLYGRRTRDILLRDLPFKHAREFVSFPFAEAMQLYFAVGGVPEYLQKASEYHSMNEFLSREFFSTTGYFYREPYFIVSQEFRELRIYFSILNAIATGRTRPTDIANFVGINARSVYPYLEGLIRMDFVKREIPVLGSPKRGVYRIKDSLLDFWFGFVFGHRDEIERGSLNLDNLDLSAYYGRRFEEFVRSEVVHLLFNYTKMGRWWHRGEEIDIVAVNDSANEILFCECKWSDLKKREAEQLIQGLQQKARLVSWGTESRVERFGVVARRVRGKEGLRSQGYVVYDLQDIKSVL